MPIFMNLNFTKGGSVGEIEIDSFSFGLANSTRIGGAGGGGATGKVTFNEITVTKSTDAASSSQLLLASDTGELLPAVQLVFMEANAPSPYLTYELQDVLISTIQWSSGGDRPTESLSFAFEKMTVVYAADRTGEGSRQIIETGGRFIYPPLEWAG